VLFTELIARAAEEGSIRRDVAARKLAVYCLHALAGAGSARSDAAVGRLVTVTLQGLQPQSSAHAAKRYR
jgi:hypothetical protein